MALQHIRPWESDALREGAVRRQIFLILLFIKVTLSIRGIRVSEIYFTTSSYKKSNLSFLHLAWTETFLRFLPFQF